MENNQDVQEVLNTLSNSISASESFASSNESFAASIAKAASAVAAMESTHYAEQQQKDHEQLQRIAAQHQQEVQQEQQQQVQQLKEEQQHQQQHQQDQQDQHQQQQQQPQPQVLPPQEQDPTTAVLQAAALQDEQHQQVLQHIATAAAEAGSTLATVPITASSPQPPAKAAVGSAEWHKIRRDNHKEVERRRRETINDGINGLAKMVPNCDKNKGSILKEAVKYIKSVLVENERLTGEIAVATTAKYEIEKYLMEKSVAEATIHSLNVQHEQLKREYEELRQKMDEAEGGPSTKKQRTE